MKGESREKSKTQFSDFTMPNRILYSTNIRKGESREKSETQFSDFTMPNRILYSTNIRKGECRKSSLLELFAKPHPIFCKYSEKRTQRQMILNRKSGIKKKTL